MNGVILDDDRATVIGGDCLAFLRTLKPNTIDAVVTDPPAGIGFMGKEWDDAKGGRVAWVAWLAEIMSQCLRVLKPGGHALVWALPRTSHWTATAIEDAGFEIRDDIHELFGADTLVRAFIESLDPEQRGALARIVEAARPSIFYHLFGTGFPKSVTPNSADIPEGTGTALKPAAEHWILARKPLDGTIAGNVKAWGTGVLNVDGCRVGTEGETFRAPQSDPRNRANAHNAEDVSQLQFHRADVEKMQAAQRASIERTATLGRWPAHVVLSHEEGCEVVGVKTEARPMLEHTGRTGSVYGAGLEGSRAIGTTPVTQTVYRCAPGCAVAALDEQAGERKSGHKEGGRYGRESGVHEGGQRVDGVACYADSGGASRFFYCAKPSKAETEAGLDHLPVRTGAEVAGRAEGSAGMKSPRAGVAPGGRRNFHPTKKSIALMRYLVRLITPPGGLVLDPFAGTGTTLIAAVQEGHRAIGCELTEDYWPIIVGRVRHALNGGSFEDPEDANQMDLFTGRDEAKPRPEQPSLFDALKVAP